MRAFYSPDQSLHDPKFYMMNGRPVAAREVPQRGEVFLQVLDSLAVPVGVSGDHGLGTIAKIHSPDYLHFLSTVYERWSQLPNASEEILPKSNPGRYAATYPADIIGRVGWHLMDTSSPLGPGTWHLAPGRAPTPPPRPR